MIYSKARDSVLYFTALGLLLAGCGGSSQAPMPASQSSASKIVAVFADTPSALEARIAQAQNAGLTPRFVTIQAPGGRYNFPVYSRIARDGDSVVVLSYRAIFVFPQRNVTVQYSGTAAPTDAATLPSISADLSRINANLAVCADCSGVALTRPQVRPVALALDGISDPWQISPDYRPWAAIPGHPVIPSASTPTITHVYVGGGSINSGTGSGGGGGGGGGCSIVQQSRSRFGSQTPYFRTPCGGGGGYPSPNPSPVNYAQKILDAANKDIGMNTRNLYGAAYRNECVAAVQKVLKDAGLSQMLNAASQVILYVPTFVQQLQVSGYSSTTTPVAGDIVDLSDGHVGICTDNGCDQMISNSSTPGTFSWNQPTATQNAAEGGGAITYYHHS